MAQTSGRTFQFVLDGAAHLLTLTAESGRYRVQLGKREFEVQAQSISPHCLSLNLNGRSVTVYLAQDGAKRYISVGGRQFILEQVREVSAAGAAALTQAVKADNALVSPMPGQVVKIQVSEGDIVERNQTLAIVEAMKMENELKASGRARVKKIHAAAGDLVDAGQVIVELEEE